MDASMNNIVLITTAGDTVDVSTMPVDSVQLPGVLINDSIKVTCEEKDVDGVKVLTATAIEVLVHSPYYFIQGTWVMPNPIDSTQMQGFTLEQDGTAKSVNMATLDFKNWNLDNYTLTMQFQSIGNKQTIDGVDTLQVAKIDADSLILSKNNAVVWALARQK